MALRNVEDSFGGSWFVDMHGREEEEQKQTRRRNGGGSVAGVAAAGVRSTCQVSPAYFMEPASLASSFYRRGNQSTEKLTLRPS